MRTTNAIDVLKGIADLAGQDRENIGSAEFRVWRDFMDNRLATAWEKDFWPELTRVEKRYFRPVWASATTYDAAAEVFYPGSNRYYQSLKGSNTGNEPADVNDIVDGEFWAEASESYSADDYDNAADYVQGDRVFYPATDLFYQLHAATSTGNLPTDTAKWGVLTEFDPYVAYEQSGKTPIGYVVAAWDLHPKLTTKAVEVGWYLSENGVQVTSNHHVVFLEFRTRNPNLRGETFDATAVYAAGDQVYFDSAATPGNFYDCLATTTAGESPESAAAKWSLVEIPLIFERYLKYGVSSDWMRHRGKDEKALALADRKAEKQLDYQSEVLVGIQGQRRRTVILTR